MTIFGIDLGTSNCLVAEAIETLSGDFDVVCLRDRLGNDSFPSVVSFKSRDEVLVGEKALFELYRNPDRTIELIKTRLGKKKKLDVLIDGENEMIPTQKISGIVLNHFNKIHDNKIRKAVLTVPAIFDDQQKKATAQSGEVADIDLIRTIPEPCAAVMYHVYSQYKTNKEDLLTYENGKILLIFDFGGGTLDLALANIKLNEQDNVEIEVLAIGGDDTLGGNIIDFKFVEVMLNYYCTEYEGDNFIESVKEEFDYYYTNYITNGELRFRDNVSEDIKSFIFRLKNRCERAKIDLSTKDTTTLVGEGRYRKLDISREEFEELVLEDGDFRYRLGQSVKDIQSKNINNVLIDQVVLVGGSAQIPYIKEHLAKTFPQLRDRFVNASDYNNAIAKGAAILAAIEEGNEVPPFGRNNVKNVVAHNLYVNQDGISYDDLPFLNYGTTYPFTEIQSKKFPIKKSLDTKINIKFVERYSRKGVMNEKIIKDINFYHPFFYTNDNLQVEVDIDELGMYKFSATHVETGEKIEFEAEQLFELSHREIEDAKREIKILNDVS